MASEISHNISSTKIAHLRTADDKFAGRLQMVDGLVVEILMRYNGPDDVLHQIATELLNADLF